MDMPPFDYSTLDQWMRNAMAPALADHDVNFRDRFIEEYFKDLHPENAALRLGFQAAFAKDFAQRFMAEPYVQVKIKEREAQGALASKTPKSQVLTELWRIALDPFAPHPAKVSALKQISSIEGLDAPAKSEQTVNVNNRVQFYLPENGRDKRNDHVPMPESPVAPPAVH
jgi:hypothetical protein